MRALILGPLTLDAGGKPLAPPSGRVGTLLRWLLLHPNETQPHERLIEQLWGADGIAYSELAQERLYVVASRLRSYLRGGGVDRAGLELVSERGGYRLRAGPAALDRVHFERAAGRALRAAAPNDAARVLAVWRGEPYAGFPASSDVRQERARLLTLRRRLQELAEPAMDHGLVHAALVTAKFLPPKPHAGPFPRRERLLERLGRLGDGGPIVVAAPAGFGKSTLLAQWARAQSEPVAWLSVDAHDNDRVRLWSSVVRALAEGGVHAGRSVSNAQPGSPRFVADLTRRLTAGNARVGLVLDDVHELTNDDLQAQVFEWITRVAQRLTVAIGSRSPQTALVRALSGIDAVRVLRHDELRFDSVEIRQVMRAAQPSFDEALVPDVAQVTEGWPIAVSFYSRFGGFSSEPDGSAGVIEEFIIDEILRTVPDDVRSFLLQTAPLDLLSSGLCDAVTGATGTERTLDWLRARDLFLIEVESEPGCFRYHHLVAEVLRHRAAVDTTVDLAERHRRAARWYRSNGLLDHALKHAIEGGDDMTTAAVAGGVLWAAAARNEMYTCRRWLHTIEPAALLGNRAAHDIATMMAAGLLGAERRAAWAESRRGHYDQRDDMMPLVVEAHAAFLDGRAHDAVAIAEGALARADAYFKRYPGPPGFREICIASLRVGTVSGRILASELDHDDSELIEFAELVQDEAPLSLLWFVGEWSFVAYVAGNRSLAHRLVNQVAGQLEGMDEMSTFLGACRLLVTAALLESETGNALVQQGIVRRLSAMADLFQEMRWHAERVAVLLALHGALFRAGDVAAAEARLRQADVLLSMFPDAPLLVAARARLGMAVSPASGDVVGSVEALSERERVVFERLRLGLTNREIADELDLSHHTIRAHVRSIYRKLGVRTRHGAARRDRSVR